MRKCVNIHSRIGASSGIGLATAKLILEGATVYNVKNEPDKEQESDWENWENFYTHRVNMTEWATLRQAFNSIKHIDFVFANASVSDVGRKSLDDEYDYHVGL